MVQMQCLGHTGYILSAGPGSWDTLVISSCLREVASRGRESWGIYISSIQSYFLGQSGKVDCGSWGMALLQGITMLMVQKYQFTSSAFWLHYVCHSWMGDFLLLRPPDILAGSDLLPQEQTVSLSCMNNLPTRDVFPGLLSIAFCSVP